MLLRGARRAGSAARSSASASASASASSVAASGAASLAAPPPPAALAAARRRQAGSLASVVPFVSAPDPLSRPHPHADAQQPDVAPVDVRFPEIYEAASRIRAFVPHTECHHSQKVSKLLGARVFFKNEFALPTGSFKERGGRNALMQLSADAARRGVIAASAGNHALALAYHGGLLGVPVTVIMPVVAPMTKVQNCRDLGATVVSHGAHIGEAREMAARIGEERGLTYINGFDHPHIIAGAGTMGLEILEQVPDVEAVVIPVGGAGLIAGAALAIKTLRPSVTVIGAEPVNCPSLSEALEAGRPVTVSAQSTIADGLLVPRVGTNAFALARKHVDRVVVVRERFIALAMLRLLEMEKAVVEGGGATGLAAMLQGLLPELRGKTVVIPLCGGNVDVPVLGRVIERGLAADGRLVRFEATVSDRPGGIAALTRVLADSGASIKDIFHERAWVDSDVAVVRVKVVVEVVDHAAGHRMFEELEAKGYSVEKMGPPVAKT